MASAKQLALPPEHPGDDPVALGGGAPLGASLSRLVVLLECPLCDLSGQFMASISDHIMFGTIRTAFRSNVR